MRRREFIAGLGGAAAWPLAARAQQRPLPVIGLLSPSRPFGILGMDAFLEGLKEGGYVDGRNAVIEDRWAEGRNDLLPMLAADLVRKQARVIVTLTVDATKAAEGVTTALPIVFQTGADPIKAGLVSRLNRPGGNVTGVSNFTVVLSAKRLDLLHQLAPKAAAIGILVDPTATTSEAQKVDLQEAANALGLRLILLNASNEQEIDVAFRALAQQRIGALFITDNTFFINRREQLVTLAGFNGVPTMYTFREFAAAGGLISYATDIRDAMRRTGNYAARILNGENPGDLPVQLPTKFELVINIKTAKALGLTIPDTLLATADEVIQ
jgi:putative tryptophan/tyrosine transport system substrate-binding protein